jgi:hypothetical protein
VPRTPGAGITHVIRTTDPTVSDDDTEAFDIRSQWVNTTTGKVWFCVDNAPGAAVWKDVSTPGAGSHPVHVDTVDPTAGDDAPSGFAIGDHWVNTAALPPRTWQAVDVSTGAAVWKRVSNLKNNIAAADPTVTDDSTQDYEIGSMWYNSTTRDLFVLIDATVGAALWRVTGPETGTGADTPGVVSFGSILFYSVSGGATASLIQYTRVKLSKGKVYDRGVTFIDLGGLAGRTIRIALYNQSTPLDATQAGSKPYNRVAVTDAFDTAGANGTYVTPELTDGADLGNLLPYEIPESGYYWIAIIASNAAIKFAVTSAVYRAGLLPLWQETSTGVVLPASAGTLANPAAAVGFCGIVEQGVIL